MRTMKQLLMAMLLIVTALLGQETHQSATKPLARAEVLALLSGGVPADRVTSIVKERGVDFVPDDDYLTQVRASGGDDALIAALQDATKIAEVDCAQYENAGGCRVWNDMLRSKDKHIVETLKTSRETYVMFGPPHSEMFSMVTLVYGGDTLVITREGFAGGLPIGIYMALIKIAGCSGAGCETAPIEYANPKEEGFRHVTLSPDRLLIGIGFSKEHSGQEVAFEEDFSRSTGRYDETHWLPHIEGTSFHKAALYHYTTLQE
jgi:hypothetical protein